MSRSLYVVVFVGIFLGCATPQSGPTEYQRGVTTPVRPAPRVTHTPAGAGMGTPGSPAQGYPRSPHKRILPETPETRRGPGIWAVTASTPDDWRSVLGVLLPLPEEAVAYDVKVVATCAGEARRHVDDVLANLQRQPSAIPLGWRACLAARIYQECGIMFLDVQNRKQNPKTPSHIRAKTIERLKDLKKTADEFARRSCKNDTPEEFTELLEMLLARLRSSHAKFSGALQ